MNLRRGFRRITLVLAITAAIIGACGVTGTIVRKRITDQAHLSECSLALTEELAKVPGPRPHGWPDADINNVRTKLDFVERLDLPIHWFLWDRFINYRYRFNTIEEAEAFMDKYGPSFEKARTVLDAYNSWAGCSTKDFILKIVLIGFVSAASGFCGVWVVYFGVLLIHRLVKWVKLGFSHSKA